MLERNSPQVILFNWNHSVKPITSKKPRRQVDGIHNVRRSSAAVGLAGLRQP